MSKIVYPIYIGNTIDVELPSLQTRSDEAHLTEATITGQLYEKDDFAWTDGAVDGDTIGDPFDIEYIVGSDSRYVGSFAAGTGLTENSYYKLVVTVTSGTKLALYVFDVQAVFRSPTDRV